MSDYPVKRFSCVHRQEKPCIKRNLQDFKDRIPRKGFGWMSKGSVTAT